MGKGVCSRRQRKIFQSFLLITIVCGTLYAFMISYEMHKQLKKTEAMAVKYQQHQESLSAQLQVVYEHRSRLEKSLQKERLEHKKAKEDYLVYKLESQQTLNKEKQDSTNRLNSLQSQHHILKSQHEDLKTQYYELQEKHQYQGEDHDRALDQHRVEMDHMQRAKEVEISRLKENAYNLREENRQLRKAHQDIHTQLLDVRQQHKDLKTSKDHLTLTLEDHKSALAVAQLQVEELKRLKGTLVKKPSVNQADQSRRPVPPQAQSHRVGAPEHRPSPEREPDHTHDQKNTQVGHQTEKEPRISHHAVQGVAKMGIDREAVKASKPAQQAETPAEGRGEEEKKMQKERKEEERRRPDPEHAILYPNELGKEPGHGQSLRHEKQQTVTEQLLLLKKQIETLDSDIAKEGDMHPHHNEGEKGDVKDIQNPEKGLREREEDVNPEDDPNNQGEDEFEEAEEQQDEMEPAERPDHRPAGSQERPAEDEQLVSSQMAGNPDQQEAPLDEQYEEQAEEEVLDDVVDPGKQRKEEVESEDDPYSEENGDQGTWNEDTNPNKQQETRIDHKANREENYKEEDEMAEEEEGPRDIYANQRAEM